MNFTPIFAATSLKDAFYAAFDVESELFFYIWPLAIGLLVGAIVATVSKLLHGKLIRSLVQNGADTKETAKTLSELGCDNFYFRYLLREGSLLRKMVQAESPAAASDLPAPTAETAEADAQAEKAQKKQLQAATRYYLPTEHRYRAQRLCGAERGMILSLPIFAACLFVLVIALFWVLPNILK